MIRRLIERFSLRTKLVALVLGLTLVVGISSVAQLRAALLETVGAELDKRALILARDLALRVTDPLLTGNPIEVREILADTMATNPDLRYAFVLNSRGALVAHTFVGGFPRDLLNQRPSGAEGQTDVQWLRSDEGLLHDAEAPIVDGLAGLVRVGLTQEHLVSALRHVERQQIIAVALSGTMAIGLGYWLILRLTDRVPHLIQAARAVGNGDMTVRVNPGIPDEFGRLAHNFNRMIDRLTEAQAAVAQKEEARTALLQKVLTAQEEERGRISRELHDEVGQALTGLIVGLRVLENHESQHSGQLPYLRNLAAGTLESVRRLSRDLRPSVLDDMGLVAAVRRYVNDFAGLHQISGGLQVVGDEERRLPPEVETTLYRVAQEALTNVARHSQAHHFGVVLDLSGPAVRLIVEDDGHGFDLESPRRGVGLTGIAERLALVNGTLTIESSPTDGTTLFIAVPLEGGGSPCAS